MVVRTLTLQKLVCERRKIRALIKNPFAFCGNAIVEIWC